MHKHTPPHTLQTIYITVRPKKNLIVSILLTTSTLLLILDEYSTIISYLSFYLSIVFFIPYIERRLRKDKMGIRGPWDIAHVVIVDE